MWKTVKSTAARVPGLRKAYHAIIRPLKHRRLRKLSVQDVFSEIYHSNYWSSSESVSGIGSNLEQTAHLRAMLPKVFRQLNVRTMLDVPCGDFNWMRHVDLSGIDYLGCDLVPEIVDKNQQYASPSVRFEQRNLIADPLPARDLILCRDCLVHFSFEHIAAALSNMVRSGSRFLATTTYPQKTGNRDIATGDWRALNLEAAPFRFPAPELMIVEGSTEGDHYSDKGLAIWNLQELSELIVGPRSAEIARAA